MLLPSRPPEPFAPSAVRSRNPSRWTTRPSRRPSAIDQTLRELVEGQDDIGEPRDSVIGCTFGTMPAWTNEEFLTVAEVAGVLKLNQQTIRNWIDAGTLPAVHVGRRVRVLRSDLDRLIESSYSNRSKEPQASTADAAAFWEGSQTVPNPDAG
jgi:excisionase family DNA binding protein